MSRVRGVLSSAGLWRVPSERSAVSLLQSQGMDLGSARRWLTGEVPAMRLQCPEFGEHCKKELGVAAQCLGDHAGLSLEPAGQPV